MLAALRELGHEVYDFKDPKSAFSWKQLPEMTPPVTMAQLKDGLDHPLSKKGFENDANALDWCDVLVLLLPCGNSAHLEAGYVIGKGKPVFVYADEHQKLEPELMYKLVEHVNSGSWGGLCNGFVELLQGLWRVKERVEQKRIIETMRRGGPEKIPEGFQDE